MHKLSKVRMLTDALSVCVRGNCVGLLSYISDAWGWKYDAESDELAVNLKFFPEALSDACNHDYTGCEFVDGWRDGIYECRLAVFKLLKPLPHLEKF